MHSGPLPTGFFTNFLTGSTAITGWTVVGPEVSIVSDTYASLGFTFPAEDGKQRLDLTGDGTNTVQGVSYGSAKSQRGRP